MAAQAGRTCFLDRSGLTTATIRHLSPSQAKPAICSIPQGQMELPAPRRQTNLFIARSMAARPGRAFPTCLTSLLSASARQLPDKATRRYTSPDMSTASMASGNRPTTPSRGPISAHTRPASSTRSTPFPATPTPFGKVYVGFSGGGYAYLSASAGPTCPRFAASPATGDLNRGQDRRADPELQRQR